MGKYISPFSDWGFKRLFGQEVNKDILLEFLNSLFEGEHVILDITFLNNEQLPETRDNRGIIYDVYCTTDLGEHIIVEMQYRPQPHFIERTLYYVSRAVASQGERGDEWGYDIDAVYGVFLMNFRSSDLESKFRSDIVLADRDTHRTVTDKLRMVYLQLPLFHKAEEQECATFFERWIYILSKMETLTRMPFTAQHAIFKKLAEIADVSTLSREERTMYDFSLKRARDNYAVLQGAKLEGRKEGLAEGEKKAFTAVALRMLSKGADDESIVEMTGLSVADIQTLRHNHTCN